MPCRKAHKEKVYKEVRMEVCMEKGCKEKVCKEKICKEKICMNLCKKVCKEQKTYASEIESKCNSPERHIAERLVPWE